ncbi:TPA: hypothetical protein N0F65_009036 [Lagenidium giganteum]|uniref:Uncharacterized protein n=1 Tax=Lagenidium giganteum TaxID=4803 RepID=A0AAV2YTZ8_9STRA|nr:TPA: hypothetical protein N0F65_009036 [Lagenidium giganteum]
MAPRKRPSFLSGHGHGRGAGDHQLTGIGPTLPSFNFVEAPISNTKPKPKRVPLSHWSLPAIGRRNPATSPRDHERDEHDDERGASHAVPDFDQVVYQTLERFASAMQDDTIPVDAKMARIWDALLRHSEAGCLGKGTRDAPVYPNPICTAIVLDIVAQVLHLCGMSSLIINVLVGGLGNSIYSGYNADVAWKHQRQFADIARDQTAAAKDQHQELTRVRKRLEAYGSMAAMVQASGDQVGLMKTALYSVEPVQRPGVVSEVLSPFLNEEMLLVIWNATATAAAVQSLHPPTSSSPDKPNAGDSPMRSLPRLTLTDHRRRATALASQVLQERVRLMLALFQTLSMEEKNLVHKAMRSNGDSVALKTVLMALEETYVAEQLQQQQRENSYRRTVLVSPSRRPSVFVQPPLQASPSSRRPMAITHARSRRALPLGELPTTPTDKPSTPSTPTRGSPRQTFQGGGGGGGTGLIMPRESVVFVTPEQAVSIPNVLLGGNNPGGSSSGNNDGNSSPNAHGADESIGDVPDTGLPVPPLSFMQEDLLRKCEVVFDLLCEDPAEYERRHAAAVAADEDNGEEPDADDPVVEAKRRLCDLLCVYMDEPQPVMDKFERSEAFRLATRAPKASADDPQGSSAFVQTLVMKARQNPQLLVHAINQSPEILLSAITHNNGILRFAITKFATFVKRFLKLDPKACEHLDLLNQKNKGVQLLWGTNAWGSDLAVAASALAEDYLGGKGGGGDVKLTGAESHMLEWFVTHTSDLSRLLLMRPEPLKQLFVEMHQRGDLSAFYKLMIQLQTTKGVQNFMRRASVDTLEKLAQEDPGEVIKLLKEIFTGPQIEPTRELLHHLRQSPFLAVCLSEFHPTAIQDVLSSNVDTWQQYFVDVVAANDRILRDCLKQRTREVENGEPLVKLFDAVVNGTTATLNLQALDFGASPLDVARAKEREASLRRRTQQCLYLRGGSSLFRAFVAQVVGTVPFHPQQFVREPTHVPSLLEHGHAHPHHDKPKTPNARAPKSTSAALATAAPTTANTSTAKPKPPPRNKPMGSASAAGAPAQRKQRAVAKDDTPPTPAATATANATASTSASSSSSSLSIPAASPAKLERVPSVSPSERRLLRATQVPAPWQSFVSVYLRDQSERLAVHNMTRGRVRTLILDICLEFLKVDRLQLDNAGLWSLAPFVCDYFVSRYEGHVVVGSWLSSFYDALVEHHSDRRVAFFSEACGIAVGGAVQSESMTATPTAPAAAVIPGKGLKLTAVKMVDLLGYDTFLYYLHALDHLLMGQVKVFKAENRFEESADGNYYVRRGQAMAVSALLFDDLDRNSVDERLGTMPGSNSASAGRYRPSMEDNLEIDDIMGLFLDQWKNTLLRIDERYKAAFAAVDGGSTHIGLDQFVKVVSTVTTNQVTARDCRMIFYDAGFEYMDEDALLRVARAYHLRAFNAKMVEVVLTEEEQHELGLSINRSNISSIEREIEDLMRFWRSVLLDLERQFEASHQTKATKTLLKKQKATVERLLDEVFKHRVGGGGDVTTKAAMQTETTRPVTPSGAATAGSASTTAPPSMPAPSSIPHALLAKTWSEVRQCAKMVDSAKLTQHYLSRIYIQCHLAKWVLKAKKRTHEQERQRLQEFLVIS